MYSLSSGSINYFVYHFGHNKEGIMYVLKDLLETCNFCLVCIVWQYSGEF